MNRISRLAAALLSISAVTIPAWSIAGPTPPSSALVLSDPLLAVDRHRASIVRRVVSSWSADLSARGLSAEQFGDRIFALRADQLLAVSLMSSLDDVLAVTNPDAAQESGMIGYVPIAPCSATLATRTASCGLPADAFALFVMESSGAASTLRLDAVPTAGADEAVDVLGYFTPRNAAVMLAVPKANSVTGTGAFAGGGDLNTASGNFSVVTGGYANTASGFRSSVGGGVGNTAQLDIATVAGGGSNLAAGFASTIAGGFNNAVNGAASYGSIGGGQANRASGVHSTVAGGNTNTASGQESSVGGGYLNYATGLRASVVGGAGNVAYGENANIGGGFNNQSGGYAAYIGGGYFNKATGQRSFVGGGSFNVATGDYATIGSGGGPTAPAGDGSGGDGNRAPSNASTVAGGLRNLAYGYRGTIGGGQDNLTGTTSTPLCTNFDNFFANNTVAGGSSNKAVGQGAFVGGGSNNTAGTGTTNAPTCTSGFSTSTATVVGGQNNSATAGLAFVGGGSGNSASGTFATIAGGAGNVASGSSSAIPGGASNTASGNSSFAAGTRAKAINDGAFVWADGNGFDFSSTAANQLSARATGGVRFVTAIDGAGATTRSVTINPNGELVFGSNTRQMLNLWGTGYGIGVQSATQYFRTEFEYAWYRNGVHSDNEWTAGVGGETLMTLHSATDVPPPPPAVVGIARAQSFTSTSDRAMKDSFVAIDAKAILAKLAAMPVTQWRYRNEAGAIRHIGPTAQDFRAAFGVGYDDKTIANIDAQGVAYAAIQGLYQMLREKDAEIGMLKAKAARMDALERKLEALREALGLQ